jgi:hypothetical protein
VKAGISVQIGAKTDNKNAEIILITQGYTKLYM